MQRVSALLPLWDRRRSNSSTATKSSAEKVVSGALPGKRPKPLQRASAMSRVACEDFWPATLDKECDRAARILKSFCSDGHLAPLHDDDRSTSSTGSSEPRTPIQIFKKIPPRIVQNAAGIAIFACMRSGLWMTGSGGSGILIARKADGTWSPPSGIMLHTPTLSFVIGVDVYDCVLIINNMAALESLITRPKVTLGEDIRLTNGPLVSLDSSEDHMRWPELDDSVLTYVKARGQSQVVNLNGCILTERGNENEKFYSCSLSAMQILAGNVSRQVEETRPLFEVIKAAEGRVDADESMIEHIAAQPAPGDAMIATPRDSPASPTSAFGLPSMDDPDPFGVLALEMAGLEIREAGGQSRSGGHSHDHASNPVSPAYSKFSRQSIQTLISESNRGSYMSTRTERTKTSDAHTQTDANNTPGTTPSHSQSEDGLDGNHVDGSRVGRASYDEIDYTKVDLTPLRQISGSHSIEGPAMTESATSTDESSRTDLSTTNDAATKASSVYTKDSEAVPRREDDEYESEHDADDEDDMSAEEEDPVVYEVASVQPAARTAIVASPVLVKGSLVTIPKRIPPPLPTRSPARSSRASKSELGDMSHLQHAQSPLRSDFDVQSTHSVDAATEKSETQESSTICEQTPAENTNEGDHDTSKLGEVARSDSMLNEASTEEHAENQKPSEELTTANDARIEDSKSCERQSLEVQEESNEGRQPSNTADDTERQATSEEAEQSEGLNSIEEKKNSGEHQLTEKEELCMEKLSDEETPSKEEESSERRALSHDLTEREPSTEEEVPAPAQKVTEENTPRLKTPSQAAPGPFPSDDETEELIPASKDPKRQSKPENGLKNRDVSPRPMSVA